LSRFALSSFQSPLHSNKWLGAVLLLLWLPSLSAGQTDIELEQSGHTLAREARWKEAIPIWEELVHRQPLSLDRVFNLALCYSNNRQPREALSVVERLHASGISDAASFNFLGKLYTDIGRFDEALSSLRTAAGSDPSNEIFQMDVASLLIKRSRHEEAKEFLNQALVRLPGSVRLRYQLGVAHAALGNVQKAGELYQQIVRANPDFEPAYIGLANLLMQDGKAQRAAEVLAQGWQRGLQSPILGSLYFGALVQSGLELSISGRHVEAVGFLEKALAIKTDYGVLIEIARSLFAIDRREQAAAFLDKATKLSPEKPEAYYYSGRRAQSLGRYQEAVVHLSNAIARDPRHLEALLALGQVEFQLGDCESAESHLRRALVLDANNVTALYWMGRVKDRIGAPSQAVDLWQQALKHDSTHIASHHQLALHYLKTGNREQAQLHFDKIQELTRSQTQQMLQSHPEKAYRQTP
jgi:tetratricopeptide (TPR) repeat protein